MWSALPVAYYVAWSVSVLVGGVAVCFGIRTRKFMPVLVGLVFAGFFTTWAVIGYRRQWQLIQSARAGVYQVVEGAVTDFHPRPPDGKGIEHFTVAGVQFKYLAGTQGVGFDQDATVGGPIREGLRVRIAHRDRRIIKLETGK